MIKYVERPTETVIKPEVIGVLRKTASTTLNYVCLKRFTPIVALNL